MKAVVITDKKNLTVTDIPIPQSIEGKVVIKVEAVGVCGSDLHYWAHGDKFSKGWIMGHEFAGYVADPGSRTDLSKGDRVTVLPSKACTECEYCLRGDTNLCEAPLTNAIGIGTPGAYAEYVMVRSHLPILLPDHISFEEATVNEPSAVGLCAARKAELKDDYKVLIVGAGIIGIVTAMWAKKLGASYVAIVEEGENRIASSKNLGIADEVFDSKEPGYLEKITAATDGKLYDRIFECVGIQATLNNYLTALKPGGKLMVLGVPNELIPFNFNGFVIRNLEMIPSHGYRMKDYKDSLQYLIDGEVDLGRFITDTKPLSEAQQVFEELTLGNTKNIKVVLKP